MLATLGASGSVGLAAGLIFIVGWVPIMVLQLRGQKWRDARISEPPVLTAEKLEVVEKEATGVPTDIVPGDV